MADTESARSKPSLRVLEEIADAEDVTPAALEPPLDDVVDPAALDRFSNRPILAIRSKADTFRSGTEDTT